MKKLLFILTPILLLSVSCKKNFIERQWLEGHWKYSKVTDPPNSGFNTQLSSYMDIEIYIDADKTFVWTEGNNEWTGTLKKKIESNGDPDCPKNEEFLVFKFDDGRYESWYFFSNKKKKGIITYQTMDGVEFELTKEVEKTRRRNGDTVVDPNNGNSSNGKG